MTGSGIGDNSWLRPLPVRREPLLQRAGHQVYPRRRLGELVRGRPPGVTGHQWSVAGRALLDLVVCAGDTGAPVFAVEFVSPVGTAGSRRALRVRDTVCAALGLEVLRVESATLRAEPQGRRVVAYLIDARDYTAGLAGWEEPPDSLVPQPVGFRDIIGRLPDGRRGPVNDLGALARVTAVEAYVVGQLVDPIVRELHVRWQDGSAEGWAWVEVRPGWCHVERTTLWARRFSCGVDLARLAGDLAVTAIGERLRQLDTGALELVSRADLGRDFERLRARRDEMAEGFDFDHLSFD